MNGFQFHGSMKVNIKSKTRPLRREKEREKTFKQGAYVWKCVWHKSYEEKLSPKLRKLNKNLSFSSYFLLPLQQHFLLWKIRNGIKMLPLSLSFYVRAVHTNTIIRIHFWHFYLFFTLRASLLFFSSHHPSTTSLCVQKKIFSSVLSWSTWQTLLYASPK